MTQIKADFPHPVLLPEGDDYLDTCSFALGPIEGAEVGDATINIPVSYSLYSDYLSDLICSGGAIAAVRAKSSSVSYSRIFPFDSNSNEQILRIGKFEVKDKIELQGVVIASKAILVDGNKPDFNPNYFINTQFNVDRGDVLALDNSRILYLDDSELEKPLSSIFSVTESEQESDIVPYYEGEKIDIRITPELYRLYYRYAYENGGMLERFATGSIVFPVLIDAINVMRARPKEENERRWCRAIAAKCEKNGKSVYDSDESAVALANELLGGIALSCLKTFDDAASKDIDSGATVEERGTD